MSTVIDTLIYDRTKADVQRVYTLKSKILTEGLSSLTTAERAEYMAGMKGAYNYTDMNRIGQAIAYIAERMTTISVELANYCDEKGVSYDSIFDLPFDPATVVVSPKTNWAMGDIPTQAQITTFLNNLSVLRRQLTLPASAPSVPTSLDGMDYEIANNMEYLLFIIDTKFSEVEAALYSMIDRTFASFAYAGILYSGE